MPYADPYLVDQATVNYVKSLNLPLEYLAADGSGPLLHLAIAFICILTIFIVLFYISRHLGSTAKGIDFWLFIPLGYFFCLMHCIVTILLIKFGGVGRHWAYLVLYDQNRLLNSAKMDKVESYIYLPSVTFPKLAILALYLRIFTTRGYRIATYCVGSIILLNCIVGLVANTVVCQPFAYFWDKSIPNGRCLDIVAAYRYISIPNVVTDLMMLILPMRPLCKLSVSLPLKLGLIATFALGSFGIVTSILRLMQFISLNTAIDDTFYGVTTMTWTIVEPSVYLITASLPSLRPLKRKILPTTSLTAFVFTRFSKTNTKQSWKDQTGLGGAKESKKLHGKYIISRPIAIKDTHIEVEEWTLSKCSA